MRSDIARVASSYLGTPFRHQGRFPGVGLDCVGVWVCALRACGVQVEDWPRYRRVPRSEDLTRRMEAQFDVVPIDDIQPGDALQIRYHGEPRHLGVAIDASTMVHAIHGQPCCASRFSTDDVFRVYRVRSAG